MEEFGLARQWKTKTRQVSEPKPFIVACVYFSTTKTKARQRKASELKTRNLHSYSKMALNFLDINSTNITLLYIH